MAKLMRNEIISFNESNDTNMLTKTTQFPITQHKQEIRHDANYSTAYAQNVWFAIWANNEVYS